MPPINEQGGVTGMSRREIKCLHPVRGAFFFRFLILGATQLRAMPLHTSGAWVCVPFA